jgi:tetratricopeptide (TPR) repeat protein
VKEFGKDEEQKERFEAALEGMPVEAGKDKAAMLGLPGHHGLAVLLALGFQDDKKGPPKDEKAPPPPPEAYPMLVKAIKLAAEKKYDEAAKALDEARRRHDERRFLYPNRPQNPRTDPREEGFLRMCDELKRAWAAQKGYPAELAKAEEAARAAAVKDIAGRLFKDKDDAKTPEDIAKLIAGERKKAEESAEMVVTLKKAATDDKKKLDGLTADVEEGKKKLVAAMKEIEEGQARAKALEGSGAAALAALKDIGKALDVKVADLKAVPELVKQASEVRRVAEMKDPKGDIARLGRELAADRATLKQRWTPAQLLDVWKAALKDRSRAELGPQAMLDVKRIAADPKATAMEKAKAQAIEGLVLLNTGYFPEAKAALEKALPGLEARWKPEIEEARQAAGDPSSGAVQKAEELAARGQTKAALNWMKVAIDGAGANKGALTARRGLMALEGSLARTRGVFQADDEFAETAAADAEASVKAGAAAGHYLAGRLAEEQGKLAVAEAAYREAVKADPKDDGHYRVALARVLVKKASAPTPRPVPLPDKMSKADGARAGAMLAAVLTALQADLPVPGAEPAEAVRLADEILAAGDKVPFDVRAQALAIKGLHTRALRAYIDGLAAQGLLAPGHANNLRSLLEGNPSLRRPDTRTPADPFQAEKAYGAGLNAYFGKKYVEAEREFASAVENDNGDARYFYFLGLARLARGDRAAYEDFDQGAALERMGRPDRAAVSRALERVQGDVRRVLNRIRSRPAKDAGK